jgi:hypothetical protein
MTRNTLCPGDPCLLREDDVGATFLASLLLRVLAEDDSVQELVASRAAFKPEPQCLECALGVMKNLKPLRTVEAHQRSVEAGRWSRARRHRQRVREGHGGSRGSGTAASASFLGLRKPPLP